jgi:hypothetical protein
MRRQDLGGGNAVWLDADGFIVRIESRRARLLTARERVPAPTLSRYVSHFARHVCLSTQRDLPCDDARWIEVAW